jgi:hypothetical protein
MQRSHSIYYTVISEPQGVVLRIWELATMAQDNHPFRYKLDYKLPSVELAWTLLNQHLEKIGAETLRYGEFAPQGGEIKVAKTSSLLATAC